jgi:uncharacterized protein (DUF362 family)
VIPMTTAIVKDGQIDYCREAPFHPDERYPEYQFRHTGKRNTAYAAVRELFRLLGMDESHYGRASWDPLGEIIQPGDHVLLKPNFVRHYNKTGGIESLVTHGSVIRAVLDFACRALEGTGKITVADAPYLDADFGEIVRLTGVGQIAAYYKDQGLEVRVADLRHYRGKVRLAGGLEKQMLPGDPLGYSVVDLKQDSDLSEIIDDCDKFRNGYYSRREMHRHHNPEHNEYCIANTVLDADVVLNLPKLKTHSKAGMTCALKNAIGINGIKDWLPHHRAGPAESGGDDYIRSDLRKDLLAKFRDEQAASRYRLYVLSLRAMSALLFFSKKAVPFRDEYEAGGWHGNDTIPRTISDLNRILIYADKNGHMADEQQRKVFTVVDGIIAGQKEGPLIPEAKKCSVLVAGHCPVEADLVCSRIMGFDYERMPVFRHVMSDHKYPLYWGEPGYTRIASDRCRSFAGVYEAYNCNFEPAAGWKGHIEYESAVQEKPVIPACEPQTTPLVLRH